MRVAGDRISETAARMLAEQKILGLYLGRGEYGPRALGARTIMASPADRSINESLNKRLERTEFVRFLPRWFRDARADCGLQTCRLPLHYTARFMGESPAQSNRNGATKFQRLCMLTGPHVRK